MAKQIKINLIALILTGIGAFLSCNPETVSPDAVKGSVTATINNVTFQSVEINANLFVSGVDSTLEVVSTSPENEVIEIAIKTPRPNTSYSFNASGNSEVDFTYKKIVNNVTLSQNTTSGTLLITDFDLNTRKINGTFSFVTDESEINNGVLKQVFF